MSGVLKEYVRCHTCSTVFLKTEVEKVLKRRKSRSCPVCREPVRLQYLDCDLTIRLNVQDLRILTQWAHQHAMQIGRARLLSPVLRRIKRQLEGDIPLTVVDDAVDAQLQDVQTSLHDYDGNQVYPVKFSRKHFKLDQPDYVPDQEEEDDD